MGGLVLFSELCVRAFTQLMTRMRVKSSTHEVASPLVLDKTVAHNAVDVLDRIVSHQVVR